MITASDVLSLIENNTPDQKLGQCELMGFLKQSLEQVKQAKDQLESWTAKEGIQSLLTPEAEKLHKEIKQILNSIVGETNR